ncbi:hypothetical protein B6N60_01121 [Richelia sinica FACHB-800]|uniref:Uncharacterized protein n=1 Tax=Richelia sinica FACHB-800 TaxID=1357546 RepID=A0A975Y3S7_9NOST|nr:hypothetical protein B6N60_01121 [Richelia sinica FACHB-800]
MGIRIKLRQQKAFSTVTLFAERGVSHRGAPVAHGGNPQDRAGLPVTCHLL